MSYPNFILSRMRRKLFKLKKHDLLSSFLLANVPPPQLEICQLIYIANQLTGFYMIGTLALKR